MDERGVKLISLLLVFLFAVSIVSATQYDVISNAAEWFVCNASGNAPYPLGGLSSENYVAEYGSFTSKTSDGKQACVDTVKEIPGWGSVYDCPSGDRNKCDSDGDSELDYPFCYRNDDKSYITHSLYYDSFLSNCGIKCEYDKNIDLKDYLVKNYPDSTICDVMPFLCSPSIDDPQSNSYTVPKSLCGVTFSGCMDGALTGSCEEITKHSDRLCGENEYCNGGTFVRYDDGTRSYENSNCCYGDYAKCETLDTSMCEELGGVIGDSENFYCSGKEVPFENEDKGCCFDGEWLPVLNINSNYFTSSSPPDKFICYDGMFGNSFAECCGDTFYCQNLNSELQVERNNVFKYFAVGSTFHSLNNYDEISDRQYVDYVQVFNNIDEATITIYQKDWTGFDFFVFDIAYNLPSIIDSINLSDGNGYSKLYPIKDYTTSWNSSFRWHRVLIPLTNTHFNYSNMYDPEITAKPSNSQLDIVLDNVFLYSDDNDTGEKSSNYYCSGDWGKWVKNLDGNESDEGFSESATISEFGPYMAACEAQGPFDWTGHRCCGDDTFLTNYGEFFPDSKRGCFNGTTVYNDWTLANATNVINNKNKGLLFYDGNFWTCNNSYFDFTQYKISYNGSDKEQNRISPIENKVTLFQDKGSWYCDPDGWVYLNDANKMRIIAATFKNLAGEDFSLHCGDVNTVMNSPTGKYFDTSNDNILPESFCVLKNNSNNKIYVGVPVSQQNIQNFLDNDLQAFFPFNSLSDDYDCSTFDEAIHPFNGPNFYQECPESGPDYLNLYYNKPFGILLFSLDSELADRSFIVKMWDSIVHFFQWMFNASPDAETIQISKDAIDADFKELYINKVGTKIIYGVREESNGENTIIVRYENLISDLTPLYNLTNQWFEEQSSNNFKINLSGESGEQSNQTIRIEGDNVNTFNWDYITSNLKLVRVNS